LESQYGIKKNYDNLVTNKNLPLTLNESWITMSVVKGNMNMKKLNLALAIFVTAVMAANAQISTNTTTPVGYEIQSFQSGNTVHAVTFVKPNLFQGKAISKTPSSLTVSGGSFGNYAPTDGLPTHYVKILDGPLVGYVFDIASNTSTSIVIDGTGLASAGSTPTFLVRQHIRLSDVFETSTGLSDGSDTFTLFNNDGTSTVALRAANDSPSGWLDPVTEQPMNPVIYPGQGFLLTTANSGTFTIAKTVESTPTVVPLYVGAVNLVSRASPSSQSMSLVSSGLGANMASGSDTVEFWTNDGSLASQEVALSVGVDGFVNPITEAPSVGTLAGGTVVNVTVTQNSTWTAPAPYTSNP